MGNPGFNTRIIYTRGGGVAMDNGGTEPTASLLCSNSTYDARYSRLMNQFQTEIQFAASSYTTNSVARLYIYDNIANLGEYFRMTTNSCTGSVGFPTRRCTINTSAALSRNYAIDRSAVYNLISFQYGVDTTNNFFNMTDIRDSNKVYNLSYDISDFQVKLYTKADPTVAIESFDGTASWTTLDRIEVTIKGQTKNGSTTVIDSATTTYSIRPKSDV